MFDSFKEIADHWHHYIPFASLMAGEPIPENRPAMTRIMEQSFVGVIAAIGGSYIMVQVQQAEIAHLKEQRIEAELRTTKTISDSEARMTQQITELRTLLLMQQHQRRDSK